MANPTMRREYPDSSQRAAVCNSQWKRRKKEDEIEEELMCYWLLDGQKAQSVQTVIFSKSRGSWTAQKARAWLRRHNMKAGDTETTSSSWRFRQFPPSQCRRGSYQTLTQNFPTGVSAVSCDRQTKTEDRT
jgi:hypothetical protein